MNSRTLAILVTASQIWACVSHNADTSVASPAVSMELIEQLAAATSDTARFRLLSELARKNKRNRKDSAMHYVERAERIVAEMNDSARRSLAGELRAEILIAARDSTAIAFSEDLVERRDPSKQPIATARAMMWLGNAYEATGAHAKADSVLGIAVQLIEGTHESELKARILTDRLGILASSRPQEAIGLGEEVLGMIDTSQPTALLARARSNLALALCTSGQYDDAALEMGRAFGTFSELRDTSGMLTVSRNLAGIQTFRSDYTEALRTYLTNTSLAKSTGRGEAYVSNMFNLANLYYNLDRHHDAIVAFTEVRRAADSLSMGELGAMAKGTRALVIAAMDSAQCYREGIMFSERNDISLRDLFEALKELGVEGDSQFRAAFLHAIGDLYSIKRQAVEARSYFDQAFAMYNRLGNRGRMGLVQMGVGNLYYQQPNLAKARAYYEKALSAIEGEGPKESIAFLLERLSTINAKAGSLTMAFEQLQRSKVISDELRGDSITKVIADIEAHSRYERKLLADSLSHVQQLAIERATAEASIDQQRTRTRAISAGGFLLLLGGGVAFAIDRKRRRERFAKDRAQFETQALRSQMNPHFIFNALNSISGFIQTNDPDQAQSFLARFSKLMRAVLENSRFREVPLSKDMEVLRTYMELERVRAQEKFDFIIEVDPTLDPTEVMVPPLIAQPFVENAIWHGIGSKAGRGHITLKVFQKNGQLRITVEDDGVGRSLGGPAVRPEDKTSLGTAITRQRLELLQEQRGATAGFRYVDIPMGTRVEIDLPLQIAA